MTGKDPVGSDHEAGPARMAALLARDLPDESDESDADFSPDDSSPERKRPKTFASNLKGILEFHFCVMSLRQ